MVLEFFLIFKEFGTDVDVTVTKFPVTFYLPALGTV